MKLQKAKSIVHQHKVAVEELERLRAKLPVDRTKHIFRVHGRIMAAEEEMRSLEFKLNGLLEHHRLLKVDLANLKKLDSEQDRSIVGRVASMEATVALRAKELAEAQEVIEDYRVREEVRRTVEDRIKEDAIQEVIRELPEVPEEFIRKNWGTRTLNKAVQLAREVAR